MKTEIKEELLPRSNTLEGSSDDYNLDTQEKKMDKNLSPQLRRSILISVLIFFTGFIIIDFLIHRKFMKLSCQLIMHLQCTLGAPGIMFSWFFSYPVTFLILPPIVFHCIYTKSYPTTIYYYSIFFIQMHATVFLKGAYGRGRPFVIGDHVRPEHCSCDYGMPSGHSSSSLAGYYIASEMVSKLPWFKAADKGRLLNFAWISISVLVGLSRMIYGVHSMNQLMYGYLISTVVILAVTEERVKWALKTRSPRFFKAIGIALCAVSVASIVSLYFINRSRKQDPQWWKYWDRCPNCQGNFANTQLVNLASLLFLPGLIFGIGVNLDSSSKGSLEFLETKKFIYIRRLGVFLSTVAVIVLVCLVVSLVVIPLDISEIEKPFVFKSVLVALSLFFTSILMTASGPLIFQKLGLASKSDFYFSGDNNDISTDSLEDEFQSTSTINLE